MSVELPVNPSESRAQPQAASALRFLGHRASWVLRQIFQCIAVGSVAIVSYLLVSHFIMQSVEVVGVSMQPTLNNAEHYFLNRWIYYLRSPRRGDVVVIKDPVDKGLSVKRIIATSGETVLVKEGMVTVNGNHLDEPYLSSGTRTFPDGPRREQQLHCKQGEFVVMGDNRMNSADSRSYGPVPRGNILGLIIR
jgi:signal peptidase I